MSEDSASQAPKFAKVTFNRDAFYFLFLGELEFRRYTKGLLSHEELRQCLHLQTVHWQLPERYAELLQNSQRIFQFPDKPSELQKAHSLNNLARSLYEENLLPEAEFAVRSAIQLTADWAALYDNLGTICAELAKTATATAVNYLGEALTNYLTALRLDPTSPTVSYNLGQFLQESGLNFAEKLLHHTLNLEAKYPDARRALGDLYLERGETNKAISSFGQAVEQNPADTRARFRLADIFWESGDYHESAQQLLAIIKQNPQDATAWHNLGLVYMLLKEPEQAETALRRAVEINPTYFLAQYHLACFYSQSCQLHQAIQHLKEAAKLEKEKVLELAHTDDKLDNLRQHPLFQQILSNI